MEQNRLQLGRPLSIPDADIRHHTSSCLELPGAEAAENSHVQLCALNVPPAENSQAPAPVNGLRDLSTLQLVGRCCSGDLQAIGEGCRRLRDLAQQNSPILGSFMDLIYQFVARSAGTPYEPAVSEKNANLPPGDTVSAPQFTAVPLLDPSLFWGNPKQSPFAPQEFHLDESSSLYAIERSRRDPVHEEAEQLVRSAAVFPTDAAQLAAVIEAYRLGHIQSPQIAEAMRIIARRTAET